MSGPTIILTSAASRQRAIDWIRNAPAHSWVEFHDPAPKRSIEQNARFHAMCTDVARQMPWRDVFDRPFKMSMENWKRFFLAMWARAEGRGTLVVPNEDGTGFYDLSVKSSKLKVGEMADLMTLMEAFGAERGITFHEDAKEEEKVG